MIMTGGALEPVWQLMRCINTMMEVDVIGVHAVFVCFISCS